jgi:hypothetical protein
MIIVKSWADTNINPETGKTSSDVTSSVRKYASLRRLISDCNFEYAGNVTSETVDVSNTEGRFEI